MDYSYLDKQEYKDVFIFQIEDNNNDLPFFITKNSIASTFLHRHKYVQIVYASKGRIKHIVNGNTFEICKGDIFVIPPYLPHMFEFIPDQGFEFFEFEFIPEFIDTRFSENISDCSFLEFAYLQPFLMYEEDIMPAVHLSGSLQVLIEEIFDEIKNEYNTREKDFELMIKSQLLRLLILVGREHYKQSNQSIYVGVYARHRDAINNAIKFINDNFKENISLDDAAKVALISQSYFRFLFKQITGKTFTDYVNSMRIAEAMRILKENQGTPITDISFDVGFKSVSNFNRVFKQFTGVSPISYRKSVQK